MKTLVVIGLGNIATRHRKNLRYLMPKAKIYAVSASGRRVNSHVEYADEVLNSIEQIIPLNPDLVIIASPATFHAEHAIPLIEAKIPLLIEKPVCTSVEQATQLEHLSQQHQTPTAVGYCLRFMPTAQKLKALLIDNVIGEVFHCSCSVGQYLPHWRPTKDYRQTVSANAHLGGGALLELSHELDYLQWLFGDWQVSHAILRQSKQLNLQVEDIADVTLHNSSGVICQLHMDFLQQPAQRHCVIVGSLGRIEWDLIENSLTQYSIEGKKQHYWEPEWDRNLMYIEMLNAFINVASENSSETFATQNIASITAATNTVRLIETIKNSAQYVGEA
ncbi:Gfo/Idh/MocA family protein [Shewanella gaetbuli]|uniref:Gfo/Idh/MocA family oxidoreductase n=1 Tax=Shewanella gaetbuli TaxID=220752 RepID=A0A9X2CJ67_9GAMM|nr:Gfo/Idh/MocA family oxidoreductase [Shewanella gaetbuli]MCL1141721.1 Gfo/Idh/MocA family oxidoreductase [Shewanella gaetbuli]